MSTQDLLVITQQRWPHDHHDGLVLKLNKVQKYKIIFKLLCDVRWIRRTTSWTNFVILSLSCPWCIPRKSADGRKPNNSTPNYSHPDTYINYCPLSRMEWATWRECFVLWKLHEAFQYNFKPLVLASWLLFIPSCVRCSALRQPLASTVRDTCGAWIWRCPLTSKQRQFWTHASSTRSYLTPMLHSFSVLIGSSVSKSQDLLAYFAHFWKVRANPIEKIKLEA